MNINQPAKKTNYIDKAALYQEFLRYEEKKKKWSQDGKKGYPPLTEKIGEAILTIAEKYASKKSFYHLPYRDEMVSEAIIACVTYVNRFDPQKSNNPFSYITMIVHNAFLQYIFKEKRQYDIKNEVIRRTSLELAFAGFNEFSIVSGSQQYLDLLIKKDDEVKLSDKKMDDEKSKVQ